MSGLSDNICQNRSQRLEQIVKHPHWDIIIVGGGISGAGILKLASQLGLKALLVEQKDFAWGSSSRSSKMVHGGLRYIAEGQIGLTLESVRERQRLLDDAQGLVTQQSFAMSHYSRQFPWPWIFNLLLSVYDFLGGKKQHKYWPKDQYQYLTPGISSRNSQGGSQFSDAMTDDARLVLRLIQEALQRGAQAINYVRVTQYLKEKGRVIGVAAEAEECEKPLKFTGKIVVNATGAWAGELLDKEQELIRIRPLRGSHLVVPSWRLPVASAISVLHPHDRRPVQVFPWQNVTVIGTTDVEHQQSLALEPRISQAEMDYLLTCVEHQFPAARITSADLISTFAGVRPVVAGDRKSNRNKAGKTSDKSSQNSVVPPSKEKRDHSVWQQPGLISVAGGKLTTFRVIAQEVLHRASAELGLQQPCLDLPAFDQCQERFFSRLTEQASEHIRACYGQLAEEFVEQSPEESLSPIAYSTNLWADLIWAVRYEQVMHLDDLLLRRTRLGNVLPNGGMGEIEQIRALCLKHLGWSESRWQKEVSRYKKLWERCYSLPTISN